MHRFARHLFLLLLCLAALCGPARAQTDKTITIRMLDSKTGLLISTSNFLVRINHLEQVHGNWVKQNEDGTGRLTLPADAEVVSIRATYDSATLTYVNCDADKDRGSADHAASPDHWYPVADILTSGVVAPNGCVGKKVPRSCRCLPNPENLSFLSARSARANSSAISGSPSLADVRTAERFHPLTLEPIPAAAFDFTLQVERLYAALMQVAATPASGEPSLGGKLLYAGELDARGRALLVAGNVAGAASLAATADPAAQKQAVRDGVADFLVTPLDEALRILKNEIRKRETVAVCVGADPESVERAMLEWGVAPDLLRPTGHSVAQGSRSVLTWRVAAAPALWLPKLDAIALDCLREDAGPETAAGLRWLRLAPRYLGRMAQGLRLVHCDAQVAKEFVARAEDAVARREIAVAVEIGRNGTEPIFCFHPRPDHTDT